MTTSKQSNGDSADFEVLYRQYAERLLGSLTRTTRNHDQAEEIAAAAFKTAFENRAGFRGESSFYTWLHAIALNEFRSAWRARQSIVANDQVLDSAGSDSGNLAVELEHREDNERLHQALQRLPAKQRHALLGHFIHGYSVKRLAEIERVPAGTILSRIHSGKRLLRRAWSAGT